MCTDQISFQPFPFQSVEESTCVAVKMNRENVLFPKFSRAVACSGCACQACKPGAARGDSLPPLPAITGAESKCPQRVLTSLNCSFPFVAALRLLWFPPCLNRNSQAWLLLACSSLRCMPRHLHDQLTGGKRLQCANWYLKTVICSKPLNYAACCSPRLPAHRFGLT